MKIKRSQQNIGILSCTSHGAKHLYLLSPPPLPRLLSAEAVWKLTSAKKRLITTKHTFPDCHNQAQMSSCFDLLA